MDEILSSPVEVLSRKRSMPDDNASDEKPLNLKGNQFIMPTPPDTEDSSSTSPNSANDRIKAASPAPSSSALSSIQDTTSLHVENQTTTACAGNSGDGQPQAKRRKLTPSEKAEQLKAKESKAVEKAEQKTKRDEEKRVKDEEKRKKAEEREAKKREKELEEERKNQEKLRKERSQMRLGAFFQKPTTPVKPSDGDEGISSGNRARRRSLSLEAFDTVQEEVAAKTKSGPPAAKESITPRHPKAVTGNPAVSDYKKFFLPFELKPNVTVVWPVDAKPVAEDNDTEAQNQFDLEIHEKSAEGEHDVGDEGSHARLSSLLQFGRCDARGLQVPRARQLLEQIQGSSEAIDLTHDSPADNLMMKLRSIPYRHLHYHEDVRPAYYGTYTRALPPRAASRLPRYPFARGRQDTDYDYDSEAEWEEPEEGEDIDNDEDDDESTGDADDMEEFLDDENDELKNKRKPITGDLVPDSTGLCWEEENGKVVYNGERDSASQAMKGMRMGFLLPGFTEHTIDPFSTSYWEGTMAPPAVPVKETAQGVTARPPLKERSSNSKGQDDKVTWPVSGSEGTKTILAAKRTHRAGQKSLTVKDLEALKAVVVGSPLSKHDLLGSLKNGFPRLTAALIKDTLGEHFAQVGKTKADKKWVFVEG